MSEQASLLAAAGLGAFHGLNPAMGWLFAVALGMHRRSWRVVLLSVLPLALGHAVSIAVVVALAVGLGSIIEPAAIRMVPGALLIGWAFYHALYGRRHRVRVGMQTGMAGLAAWSFLMATAHGAGVMLIPALAPVLMPETHHGTRAIGTGESWLFASIAVGVHTAALVLVTGLVALAVYVWVGLGFLRRGWVNLDAVWILALTAIGIWMLLS